MDFRKEYGKMNRYKYSALLGTVIMGIGSFLGCLAENRALIHVGNVMLIVSMFVMVYGYSKWQP